VRRRDEEGQTALLIVGFFLVAVLLVVVVVDASAAYLRRQQLDALADGAALAAADGIQGSQVYEQGLGDRAAIDPGLARSYVADYLDRLGAGRDYPGLVPEVQVHADTVEVVVHAPLDLPLVPPGWTENARVTGRASAFVAVTG
jgi:hypothetical protein